MPSRLKAPHQLAPIHVGSAGARPRRPMLRHRRQDGAFAIMFAALLIVLVAFCALAIDVGPLYNRKADLNAMADAVALAAARELNGTAAGISAAKTSARAAAERMTYKHGIAFEWDDAALSFSATAARSGTWTPASGTVPFPEKLYYAKVDTTLLDSAAGEVHPFFMSMLWSSLGTIRISESAVAGRTTVNVTPIAICAMSSVAADQRVNAGLATNELVQYGFRRGVPYDLMQLNPETTTPARYLVNPVIAPGGDDAVFDTAVIGQFVCTGTMWVPSLTGGAMHVYPLPTSSPLAGLSAQLNSRFDDYSAKKCSPNGAPPDYNVKPYPYDTDKAVAWMKPTMGLAAAAVTTTRNKRETIADLPAPPAGTGAGDYGPLWAYAKAAKYAASEPSSGYATFDIADWKYLYKSGPVNPAYPTDSPTPYTALKGSNYYAPALTHTEIATDNRRVLNIPLLSCPITATANEATVVAVARFFMTVPASADKLIAEFAGVVPAESLSGLVELYP
jgi:hypothetical protein